jgi:putative Mn2+ efflux pump MntP
MTDDAKLKAAKLASAEALKSLATSLEEPAEKPGVWASIFTITVALGLVFPIAFLRGWAALKVWQWFAAPVWPSVHLTIYTMVGLMILISAFKNPNEFNSDTKDYGLSKVWTNLFTSIAYPLSVVGVAWLWTWLAWGQ